jgi:hypothetical protein
MGEKRRWVYIEWLDAYGPTENKWTDPEILRDLVNSDSKVIIKEVGLLVHEDKKYVTIVHKTSETTDADGSIHTDMVGTYTRIPIGMVLKIIDLNSLIK